MRLIYVALPVPAAIALREVAQRETRQPREQAAHMLIAALRQSGALKDEEASAAVTAEASHANTELP